MIPIIWFTLAGISFIVAIFFLVQDIQKRRKRQRRYAPPPQRKSIEETLAEAKKIQQSLKGDNPPAVSEILLVHLLNEIRETRSDIRSMSSEISSEIGGLRGLIYFVSGILLSGEFLIIGLLWSLR